MKNYRKLNLAAHITICKMLTEVHKRELQIYQLARNRFLDGPMRIPRFYYGIEWDIEANKQVNQNLSE